MRSPDRTLFPIPVATAEPPRPLETVRRSFALTAGHYWRLLAVLLLAGTVALVLLTFAQLVGGIIAKLLFGLFLILAVLFLVLAALGIGAVKKSVDR